MIEPLEKRRASGEVADILDGLISGRDEDNAVCAYEIMAALGYKTINGVSKTMKHWLDNNDGTDWVGKRVEGRRHLYFDKEAKKSAAPSVIAQRNLVSEAYAHAAASDIATDHEPPAYRFALWDDGRLVIHHDDQRTDIASGDVRRLARLLAGVSQ